MPTEFDKIYSRETMQEGWKADGLVTLLEIIKSTCNILKTSIGKYKNLYMKLPWLHWLKLSCLPIFVVEYPSVIS